MKPRWVLLAHFVLALVAGLAGGLGGGSIRPGVVAPVVVPPVDPPVVVVPPSVPVDPVASVHRVSFGNAGCTGTVVLPRRVDGRWLVLSAGHCVSGVGQKGQLCLPDGCLGLSVVSVDRVSDCSWSVTDSSELALVGVRLAASSAAVGARVWHCGFGVDRPGSREDGVVEAGPDGKGQCRYRLSVSSGDSGAGIFSSLSGELLSPVCCTERKGSVASVWGASPESCSRVRRVDAGFPWIGLDIPIHD
jgi:hypothetical protein